MAPSSVCIAEPIIEPSHDDPRSPKTTRSVKAEILHPVEHLHRRFDDSYDQAEQLRALVQVRQSRGIDCAALLTRLKAADAERMATLAALRKARWLKTV